MKILCLTQARSLELFASLVAELDSRVGVERAGFHVADREHYEDFTALRPDFEISHVVTKEWEILSRAASGTPDQARLVELEAQLGDPTLWGALVADRRVYLGRHATLRQDYSARFGHARMLRILEEGAAALEKLFDEVQPDVVMGFICVTFADYLGYLIARSRRIPFLNLRPTRIRNYVHFAESVFEPSERTRINYEARRGSRESDSFQSEALAYLEEARRGDARYEGVATQSGRPSPGALRSAQRFARRVVAAWGGGDNHAPDPLVTLWHTRFGRGSRRRALLRLHRRQAGPPAERYALFPLHTEPEVTLLVYSRACMNQIEVVRNLAQALPVGMEVLIKEHPAAIGKRPEAYYRKLLAIPGVRLAEPGSDSRPLVEGAALVATIAGSIGLEALVRERPVLLFGHAPYEILPPTMVRRVAAPETTAQQVAELLAAHHHDEAALRDYVAAVMETSVPASLYSGLLGRGEAYAGPSGWGDAGRAVGASDIEVLAGYAVESLKAVRARLSPRES